MLAIATQNNIRNTTVEEADSKIGAHFAGLVKHEPETMPSLGVRSAPVANDHEIDDEEDDHDDGFTSSCDAPERWSKAALMRIIAERLVAARLMNGYSQTEAAERLKYATPAQLSQWEQCRRAAPLHMLMRASELYSVSMDFLTGVSTEPERDARAVRRNAVVRAVRSTLVAAAERVVHAFDQDEAIVGLNVGAVREIVAAAEAVTALFDDFSQKHKAGPVGVGARLAAGVGRLESAALKAGIALRKHDDEDARMKERLAAIAANDAG